MNRAALPEPEATPAGLVAELHGMLNWLLPATGLWALVIISRLAALPETIAAFFRDNPDPLPLSGNLLLTMASLLPGWQLIRLSASLIRLRSGSTASLTDTIFRRLHLLWRSIFTAAVLSGAAYVLAFPSARESERREVNNAIDLRQRIEEWEKRDEEASRKDPTPDETAAKKHAEHIRQLEEEYYRQKREREAAEKSQAPPAPRSTP